MTKQIIRLSFLTAIIIAAGLFSCKTKKAEADGQKETMKELAKNPNIGAGTGTFEITAPEGWTKSDTSFMGFKATFLMSPIEGTSDIFQENVNVITEGVPGISLDKYMELSKESMTNGLSQFSISGSGETEINGMTAKWIDYSHSAAGNDLDVRVWLILENNIGYAITASTLKNNMSKWKPQFEQAVNTFRIK